MYSALGVAYKAIQELSEKVTVLEKDYRNTKGRSKMPRFEEYAEKRVWKMKTSPLFMTDTVRLRRNFHLEICLNGSQLEESVHWKPKIKMLLNRSMN